MPQSLLYNRDSSTTLQITFNRTNLLSMKTFIQLKNSNTSKLPAQFQHDDVRYSERLVECFLDEFTSEQDIVFDPFAGYGTTLFVAQAMGRIPYGIELDQARGQYIQSKLNTANHLIIGDSRHLFSYNLPAFDFSMTSPPYMGKGDEEDPLSAYAQPGQGYQAYLQGIGQIYQQMKVLMKPSAKIVIEVANIKQASGVTRLAWDIAEVVSQHLTFEGEIIACWDNYGYGYDHSYCLIFSK